MSFTRVVALAGLVGCAAAHKDAETLVDPDLVAQGQRFERAPTVGGFVLGPYAIRVTSLRREPLASKDPVVPGTPSHPGERIEFVGELSSPKRGRVWTTRCEAVRRPTGQADFGAVLDETKDAIQIDCTLSDDAGAAWSFSAQGLLSDNFGGRLQPRDRSVVGGALAVEVLLFKKRFDTVKRHLSHPVAQVKMGRAAIAAVILARPERAWIASDAPPELTEVSLALLTALDQMPLGFEG
jgi:hypothetical protein